MNQTTNQTPQASKKKMITALKKSIGAINKTIELLEHNDYIECSDVLVQIDSAVGSLQSSRGQVIDKFLDLCIQGSVKSSEQAEFKSQMSKLYKLTK
jgi:DNA-binding FrmR family transcriptional regulator